ncbi:4Fe-4S binding protein, partial [Klebsiella aerogenes]|uniref:4Fe-4S binding protein n=1 Tax=Klebsiella aerogenes TaxID=548 RepID=UPI001D0D6D5B
MFTFIKKVIKTGTATHSYPLEPMPVDKNFRGKPEHNPQQCIGCAACVNACPSNALTVETDLATNQLASQFNTIGWHQAFLTLAFRAGLKTFAV